MLGTGPASTALQAMVENRQDSLQNWLDGALELISTELGLMKFLNFWL